MTTKKSNVKTKRRATKSSAKKTKPKGELAKYLLSPARAKAIAMQEESLRLRNMDPDRFAKLNEGPKFPFEDEYDNKKIPKAAWEFFLDKLRESGNVTKACVLSGVKRVTVYKHAQADEQFAKDMKAAHEMGLQRLEDVAVGRATEGVYRPVFFQGEVVGYTREYSDQLLQFLLKGNMKKYRDGAREEESGRGGGVLVVPANMDTSDWEKAALAMQQTLREEVTK